MASKDTKSNIIPGDFSDRTIKGPSPFGTTVFVGLRAADVVLQYFVLSRGWGASLIDKLGGQPVPASNILAPAGSGFLGLQPYGVVVNALALGSAVKQIIWILFVSEQTMPAKTATLIAFFNTAMNTTNTLLSLWSLTSLSPYLHPSTISPSSSSLNSHLLPVGITLYTLGLTIETVSEFQRKAFKARPENKGKPYGGGLFSLATNINYGGYTLWRMGYAMICGGATWGVFIGGFFFLDFTRRAIPVLDEYCSRRYGAAWEEVKKRVPYRLIPWIY